MSQLYPDKEHRELLYEDVDNLTGNSAERTICDWIEKAIKDNKYIAKLHPQISTRKPDLVMLIPNKGLLVIEVKSYSADFIEIFDDNSLIQVKEEFRKDEYTDGVKHPYKQATEFQLTIVNDLTKFFKRKGIELPICKIGAMIAMPNLTDDEYEDLLLNYGVDTELCITKDWLESEDIFYKRFTNAVDIIFRNMKSSVDFDDYYYKIIESYLVQSKAKNLKINTCDFIEDKRDISIETKSDEKECSLDKEIEDILFKDNICKDESFDYSNLKIVFDWDNKQEIWNQCEECRKRGTQIYLVCVNFSEENKSNFLKLYKKMSNENKIDEKENSFNTFLFNLYFISFNEKENSGDILFSLSQNKSYINIIDGELIERIYEGKPQDKLVTEYVPNTSSDLDKCLWSILIEADKNTLFNFDQYIIEHFPIGQDMCITASAGTGKTYTMVQRVAFLVHKEIIQKKTCRSIDDLIYMMTFTNDSTDEMKKRLQQYYSKYFALTGKEIYMNIVEDIGKVTIKTIDSMSKYIIQRFSYYIGLSSNFKIRSGKYDLDNMLKKNIDKYINDEVLEKFEGKPIYEIQEYVMQFMAYMKNRKISFDKNSQNRIANQNHNRNSIKDYIEKVIKETNTEFFNYNRENNYLSVDDIGIQLDNIMNSHKEENNKLTKINNKYLFIDEFQDTDNKQIELINYFADYFNMSLFIVGDIKQCIYGFRGAEDTAFTKIQSISSKKPKRDWNMLSLRKNYRTIEPLIGKLNSVFTQWDKNLFHYDSTDILEPQIKSDLSKEECWIAAEYNEDSFIKFIKDRRNELLNEKNDKNRVIAILVRKNSEINKVKLINEKINDFNIEFNNDDDFYNTDAVIDFYKLVDFLSDMTDIKRMYNISTTPYCINKIPKSKFYISANKELTIEEFDRLAGLPNNRGFIYYSGLKLQEEEEQACLKNSPALKILKIMIDEIKPWERYKPEYLAKNENDLNQARNEYRRNLFQLFQIFIDNNKSDYLTLNKIRKFLEINIITKQKMSVISENRIEDNEKVKVICTTIHKSKGLQYDTVVLPFTTSDITKDTGNASLIDNEDKDGRIVIEYNLKDRGRSTYKSADYDALYSNRSKNQLSEELRILYVALTRAEKKVIYLYESSKINSNKTRNKKYWAEYLKVGR